MSEKNIFEKSEFLESLGLFDLDSYLEEILSGHYPQSPSPAETTNWRLGMYFPRYGVLFQGDNLSENHNMIVNKYIKEMPVDDEDTQGVVVFDHKGKMFIVIDTERGSKVPMSCPPEFNFYIYRKKEYEQLSSV